ncbi:50S ribosomal protein L20 [Dehalococcoidia bacterium]|nr:50S ribosomal protein L20 [Dehalococcoidia bacterium]
MPRVKRGVTARARHSKVLKLTKGQRGTKSTLFRRAHEAMLKALSYAYRHRRERKGDMRRLWIARVNAAARREGMSYSQFMGGLKKAGVGVNRKVLADLAVKDSVGFARVVEVAKEYAVAE